MPLLKPYRIFISHAWKYSEDYYGLERLLQEASLFEYRNYSVPKHNPLFDPGTPVGKRVLTAELDEQIRQVQCVLVLGGMYAAYREWIQTEIDIARRYSKPIIAVIPWGQQRVPVDLQNVADETVHWNTTSIVNAIRKWSL